MSRSFYISVFIIILPILTNGQSYELTTSIGADLYSIKKLSLGFELKDISEAQMTRNGFSNPLTFGFGVGYIFSEKYKLKFETEFSYMKYTVSFSRNYPLFTDPLNIKTSVYDVPWLRGGIILDLDYSIYSYKNIGFFYGGGLGIQMFTPAVSDDFLYDTLIDKLSELDTSDDIDLAIYFSSKLRFGTNYKIENSSIKLSVFLSNTFVFDPKYETPTNYFSLNMGLDYIL